jgi:hypothetical protein
LSPYHALIFAMVLSRCFISSRHFTFFEQQLSSLPRRPFEKPITRTKTIINIPRFYDDRCDSLRLLMVASACAADFLEYTRHVFGPLFIARLYHLSCHRLYLPSTAKPERLIGVTGTVCTTSRSGGAHSGRFEDKVAKRFRWRRQQQIYSGQWGFDLGSCCRQRQQHRQAYCLSQCGIA